ncbi:MAG: hemolysin family protein [Myxococcaceae bacterium]
MPTWAIWVVCLGFILLRALLAAAEAALYGTSDLKAKELATVHPRRGRRVLKHKTEREATAATLRLAITLCGFNAVALATLVPPRLLEFSRFGDAPWVPLASLLAGGALMALLAAVVDVLFRAVAISSPETWALWTSGAVSLLKVLLYPLLRLLVGTLNLIVRPFGGRVRFEAPPPPLEELEKLLQAQAASENLDKGAPQLIRSIFELSDKRSRDVMVPRTEVVGVEVSTSSEEILRLLAEENHSRLPVFQDDMDHIVGVLHARDLIPMMQHPELIVLRDIVRPANFVPWVKPIGDLLREMQKKRLHMAIVVDEYGGFMGIVTLEDILREIVGDIGDEFEVVEKEIERQPDGSYVITASMEREAFERAFATTLPDGEFETLGGFLATLSGSIPEVGDKFTWGGFTFVVMTKDGAKLERVRVVKPVKGPIAPAPTTDKERAKEKPEVTEERKRQEQAALARGTG